MKRVTRRDDIQQQPTAKQGRERMIARIRKDGAEEKPETARESRERMNERLLRNDGTSRRPTSAKEARERMVGRILNRNDGSDTTDTQKALSNMMRTPGSEAYKQEFGGDKYDRMRESILKELLGGPNDTAPKSRTLYRTPDQARQEMIERRSGIKGTGAEPDVLRKGGNQAELARARMLDRMSGACPDRLPRDYNPLPGNDR